MDQAKSENRKRDWQYDKSRGHSDIRGAMRLSADGLSEVRIPVCLRHSIDSQIVSNEPVPAAPACSAAAQMEG